MRFYDTAEKSLITFVPNAPTIGLYTCGITPYDSAHLGHIFTFMTYDLLQRRLEDLGYTVHLVRNITDVDEPIYAKAAELGLPYTELAEKETAAFRDTLQILNFRPAFAEPKASDYISQMATAVTAMLADGIAYYVDQDVYFDICRVQDFGLLSGYSKRLKLAYLRNRGGDPDRRGKRHALDFLLWRSIKDADDLAAWDSPVGRGRPGWHIECTVMSKELLGIPFDIHGGGSDLIFPHHEAEIAQSLALTKHKPARHWLHVAPLLFAGEKMSKSLGNLVFAKDLLGQYAAPVIRLALMSYQYRVGGEWLPELMDQAQRLFDRLLQALRHAPLTAGEQLLFAVQSALDDDLNTPAAIGAIEQFIHNCRHANDTAGVPTARRALDLLGIATNN